MATVKGDRDVNVDTIWLTMTIFGGDVVLKSFQILMKMTVLMATVKGRHPKKI